MTTHRADYRYVVKEFESGTPWIMFELIRGPELPLPRDTILGFGLAEGTTLEEAQEVARLLTKHVRFVNMTV